MNLSKLLRLGYKTLSILNTANVIASGNPNKIARHIVRRQLVKKAGTFGVTHKRRGHYNTFWTVH